MHRIEADQPAIAKDAASGAEACCGSPCAGRGGVRKGQPLLRLSASAGTGKSRESSPPTCAASAVPPWAARNCWAACGLPLHCGVARRLALPPRRRVFQFRRLSFSAPLRRPPASCPRGRDSTHSLKSCCGVLPGLMEGTTAGRRNCAAGPLRRGGEALADDNLELLFKWFKPAAYCHDPPRPRFQLQFNCPGGIQIDLGVIPTKLPAGAIRFGPGDFQRAQLRIPGNCRGHRRSAPPPAPAAPAHANDAPNQHRGWQPLALLRIGGGTRNFFYLLRA